MNAPTLRRLSALAAAALLSMPIAGTAVAAGPVTVQLNGNTLNLNPAPTERAGRVFVPLRGVFENLGASVVYANGVINASGRGHNISLHIGSQQATVDGQQQTIDVAPFIIGASTYVPLRFVSQALGATVNWDNANRVVAITAGGNVAQNPPQTVTAQPAITPTPNRQYGAVTLDSTVPARGATVSARRPTIEATFGGAAADPNSMKVVLDQLDITAQSLRQPRGFSYVPPAPLQAGVHRVRVSGTDVNGQPFFRGWQFTSGTSSASAGQITELRPGNGATVGNQFTVSGRTSPGARVTIQVGASGGSIGGLIGAILGGSQGGNTATYTVNADGNGAFSQQVSIGAPSGSDLVLVVNATDPQTGASGTPVREQLRV